MSKKASTDELGTELEKLAVKLAKDLSSGETVAKQTSDTFGKLTGYYAATRRLNLKAEDEDPDAPNFGNFRDKINKA